MNIPLPKRYQVNNELGRGGSSVVYSAYDTEMNSTVAVKVLLCREEAERFRLEAERMDNTNHPNIVAYRELGQFENRDYLVMECLPEGDLNQRVKEMSADEILEIFIQLCDGLDFLHKQGLVHRDIKPSNILFDDEGRPKITDLGLARHMEQTKQLTQAGAIIGTYSYMSPEQILCSKVGPSADLYSLGVCLFKALTGVKPFRYANDFAMLTAHLQEAPPSVREYLPEASDDLVALVEDLLAKDKSKRPSSALEVAERLKQCLPGAKVEWEKQFLALDDELRSTVLIMNFLADEATFDRVCLVSSYAEDKIDQFIETLLSQGFIKDCGDDRFGLVIPSDLVGEHLSSRVRRLYERRLQRHEDSKPTLSLSIRQEPVWLPEAPLDDFDIAI